MHLSQRRDALAAQGECNGLLRGVDGAEGVAARYAGRQQLTAPIGRLRRDEELRVGRQVAAEPAPGPVPGSDLLVGRIVVELRAEDVPKAPALDVALVGQVVLRVHGVVHVPCGHGVHAAVHRLDGDRCHVQTVEVVVDEHVAVGRGVAFGQPAPFMFGGQLAAVLCRLEADLPEEEGFALPAGDRHVLVQEEVFGRRALPRRPVRVVGVRVVGAEQFAHGIRCVVGPQRTLPDLPVLGHAGIGYAARTADGDPAGQLTALKLLVQQLDAGGPLREVAVCAGPAAVGLVDEVVVADAAVALRDDQVLDPGADHPVPAAVGDVAQPDRRVVPIVAVARHAPFADHDHDAPLLTEVEDAIEGVSLLRVEVEDGISVGVESLEVAPVGLVHDPHEAGLQVVHAADQLLPFLIGEQQPPFRRFGIGVRIGRPLHARADERVGNDAVGRDDDLFGRCGGGADRAPEQGAGEGDSLFRVHGRVFDLMKRISSSTWAVATQQYWSEAP